VVDLRKICERVGEDRSFRCDRSSKEDLRGVAMSERTIFRCGWRELLSERTDVFAVEVDLKKICGSCGGGSDRHVDRKIISL